MNLVIDIGNTRSKLAIFDKNEMLLSEVHEQINEQLLDQIFTTHNITKAIYASVVQNESTNQLLKKYNFLGLTHSTPLPLQLNYKTPETLGLDRICAVVGASATINGSDVLVIDIGTCITYDFMNAAMEYIGGGISPGFQMRFKALEHFTSKLPLVTFKKEDLTLIGDTTEKSIVSGVYNGMQEEINGIINRYCKQYETVKVVVTGGDRNLFDLEPKNRIFADEFLVQKGLNEILNYNEK